MSTSANRVLGSAFGAVYLLIGVLGFTATFGTDVFATEGGLLVEFFQVNIFQNIVHIVIGAALVMAGLSNTPASKTVNSIAGTAYLVLGLAGLFLVGSALNILALNVADNVLHFGSAVFLLAVGLGADKRSPAAA